MIGAAIDGSVSEIKRLVQQCGKSPNEKMSEWYDSTPLSWSCALNQLHATVELVRLGGDPNIINKGGNDAIKDATREGCYLIVEFLN